MEKPKLDWKTFTARRRLDVGAWIKAKGFKNYTELKKWLLKHDMEPPAREEVLEHFKKPRKAPKPKVEEPKVEEPKVEADKEEPQEAPKRRGRRPKKSLDESAE